MGGLFCARRWGLPAVFVSADDTRLRRLAASGGLADVHFAGEEVAVHTTYAAGASYESHFGTARSHRCPARRRPSATACGR